MICLSEYTVLIMINVFIRILGNGIKQLEYEHPLNKITDLKHEFLVSKRYTESLRNPINSDFKYHECDICMFHISICKYLNTILSTHIQVLSKSVQIETEDIHIDFISHNSVHFGINQTTNSAITIHYQNIEYTHISYSSNHSDFS